MIEIVRIVLFSPLRGAKGFFFRFFDMAGRRCPLSPRSAGRFPGSGLQAHPLLQGFLYGPKLYLAHGAVAPRRGGQHRGEGQVDHHHRSHERMKS